MFVALVCTYMYKRTFVYSLSCTHMNSVLFQLGEQLYMYMYMYMCTRQCFCSVYKLRWIFRMEQFAINFLIVTIKHLHVYAYMYMYVTVHTDVSTSKANACYLLAVYSDNS